MMPSKKIPLHTLRHFGNEIEGFARKFLEQQGLDYIDENYQTKTGEIDLIMQDNKANSLVFVEVRFRADQEFGGGLESISRAKQTKIIRTAKLYLLEKQVYDKVFCRFDVVIGETKSHQLKIDWYKNAFSENFV